MRALLSLFCTAIVFLSVSPAEAKPSVGSPAPEFSSLDTNDTMQALANYRGNIVVLEWTNHLCPFVQKHYGGGNMQALQKEYTEKGVVWLSIISSAPGKQGHVNDEEANALTEERDASPTAVIRDPSGTIGQLYGAATTPHMFVIDEEGVLRYMGAIDSIPSADKADIEGAENYVRLALDALLAGEEIATPVTSQYGCSVKYAE